MTPSFQSIRNVLLAKGYVALATLLLCVSVLGVQGLGLFHSVVHAHPSLSEVFHEAALAVDGRALNL